MSTRQGHPARGLPETDFSQQPYTGGHTCEGTFTTMGGRPNGPYPQVRCILQDNAKALSKSGPRWPQDYPLLVRARRPHELTHVCTTCNNMNNTTHMAAGKAADDMYQPCRHSRPGAGPQTRRQTTCSRHARIRGGGLGRRQGGRLHVPARRQVFYKVHVCDVAKCTSGRDGNSW